MALPTVKRKKVCRKLRLADPDLLDHVLSRKVDDPETDSEGEEDEDEDEEGYEGSFIDDDSTGSEYESGSEEVSQ
jgi:hypothetical protein